MGDRSVGNVARVLALVLQRGIFVLVPFGQVMRVLCIKHKGKRLTSLSPTTNICKEMYRCRDQLHGEKCATDAQRAMDEMRYLLEMNGMVKTARR